MMAYQSDEGVPRQVGDRFTKTSYRARPWWHFWRRTPRAETRTFVVTHVSADGKIVYERVL